MKEVTIKGAHGGRIDIDKGQLLELVNVEGTQILDFFAFNRHDAQEHLSTSHCRTAMRRVILREGDTLVSDKRSPMFLILEDKVGVNDISIPACDPYRYRVDFGIAEHRSCRDNLAGEIAELGIPYAYLPDPVNFWQVSPIRGDGTFGTGPSPAKPGDRILLKALMDMIVVGSACPQDQTEGNGYDPSDIKMIVRDG